MTDPRPIRDVPRADHRAQDVADRMAGRTPVVFLDYDGTLTPIVTRPEDATIDDDVRAVLVALAEHCTVAIISGRDLDDVRAMVAVPQLYYAGSHGFDILTPEGERTQHGTDYDPVLDAAQQQVTAALDGIEGAWVERKRFAIAVHYRQADPARAGDVEAAVRHVVAAESRLRMTGGKMIFELRPNFPWDKGRALLSVLETLGMQGENVIPVYVGDDETDEDAFKAITDRGLSLVVRGEDDDRPTLADYTLDDPAAVVTFLGRLREQLAGGLR